MLISDFAVTAANMMFSNITNRCSPKIDFRLTDKAVGLNPVRLGKLGKRPSGDELTATTVLRFHFGATSSPQRFVLSKMMAERSLR
jgi:hypothetical protein